MMMNLSSSSTSNTLYKRSKQIRNDTTTRIRMLVSPGLVFVIGTVVLSLSLLPQPAMSFSPSIVATTGTIATSSSSFQASPSSTKSPLSSPSPSSSSLSMVSSYNNYRNDKSKRQERVGQIVRTELASIIQLGYPIKNQHNELEDELRRRINVVNADVSPDLRQARITVSVIKRNSNRNVDDMEEEDDDEEDFYDEDDDEEFFDDDDEEDGIELNQVFPESSSSKSGDAVVDRRRSYAWLVRNTKQIRHAMSQRLSHMKTIPNLTFVLADVGAAVDVMNLIDKVSKGNYKRDDIGMFGGENDNLPSGMYLESELDDDYEWFDDEDDDIAWLDEEEDEDTELSEGGNKKDAKLKGKQK